MTDYTTFTAEQTAKNEEAWDDDPGLFEAEGWFTAVDTTTGELMRNY